MSERSGPPTESATPFLAPPTDYSPPTDSRPSGKQLARWFFLSFFGLLLFFALYIIGSFYFINPPVKLPTGESTSGGVALRGQFGDMFGVVTAFFTGLGFIGVGLTVVWQWRTLNHQERERSDRIRQQTDAQKHLTEQIELLKKSTDAETRAIKMQRAATSMDILTRMGEKFDSKEIRYARYVASKFFLDARNYWAGELKPDVTQDAAIRDILNFFEQMAHYANAEGIDEEMMLNAYYFGMEAYWHFAERSFLPKDYASSLEWIEIRKLREKAPQWLRKEYFRHMPHLYESEDKVPKKKVQVASRDALTAVLKREVARCKEPRRSAASNRLAIDRLV